MLPVYAWVFGDYINSHLKHVGKNDFGSNQEAERVRQRGRETGKQVDRQGGNWVYTASVYNPPATVICLFTYTAWQVWIILSTADCTFCLNNLFTSMVDLQLHQKLTFCVTLSALTKTRMHLYTVVSSHRIVMVLTSPATQANNFWTGNLCPYCGFADNQAWFHIWHLQWHIEPMYCRNYFLH